MSSTSVSLISRPRSDCHPGSPSLCRFQETRRIELGSSVPSCAGVAAVDSSQRIDTWATVPPSWRTSACWRSGTMTHPADAAASPKEITRARRNIDALPRFIAGIVLCTTAVAKSLLRPSVSRLSLRSRISPLFGACVHCRVLLELSVDVCAKQDHQNREVDPEKEQDHRPERAEQRIRVHNVLGDVGEGER